MSNVYLQDIPDVPEGIPHGLAEVLKAMKQNLEVLTGKVGGNDDLIEYMEADTTCPKCGV